MTLETGPVRHYRDLKTGAIYTDSAKCVNGCELVDPAAEAAAKAAAKPQDAKEAAPVKADAVVSTATYAKEAVTVKAAPVAKNKAAAKPVNKARKSKQNK